MLLDVKFDFRELGQVLVEGVVQFVEQPVVLLETFQLFAAVFPVLGYVELNLDGTTQ